MRELAQHAEQDEVMTDAYGYGYDVATGMEGREEVGSIVEDEEDE